MEPIRIIYVSRNDYKAIFECECCHKKYEAWGYDDLYFDNKVIPNAICPNCNKSASGETKEEQQKRLGRTFRLDITKEVSNDDD